MSLIKAGGVEAGSAACAKALAACGINPKGFGSYSSVNKTQAAKRKELGAASRKNAKGKKGKGKAHVPPCQGKPSQCRCHSSQYAKDNFTPEEYLHANSQSGHMSQDAFFRQPGGRFDPCQNHPPGKGHSGTMGYDGTKAPCMDHIGMSSTAGSPHALVCQTEADFAKSQPKGPMTQAQIEAGVARSAAVAVTGSRWKYPDKEGGKTTMTRVKETDPKAGDIQREFSQKQIEAADSGKYGASGAAASKTPATNFNQLSNNEKLAIACIVAEFRQGMADMRKNFEQDNGPAGNAKAQQKARAAYQKEHGACPSWDKMSDEQKAKACQSRMKELQGQPPFPKRNSAAPPTASQKAPGKPSKQDCREYQACWLTNQQLTKGKVPPMQPQNAHGYDPPTTTSGGKKTSSKGKSL